VLGVLTDIKHVALCSLCMGELNLQDWKMMDRLTIHNIVTYASQELLYIWWQRSNEAPTRQPALIFPTS